MNTVFTIVCISFLGGALYNQFAKPSKGRFIWLALVSGVTYYFLTHVTVEPNVILGSFIGAGVAVVGMLVNDLRKAKSNKAQ